MGVSTYSGKRWPCGSLKIDRSRSCHPIELHRWSLHGLIVDNGYTVKPDSDMTSAEWVEFLPFARRLLGLYRWHNSCKMALPRLPVKGRS